MYVNLLTITRSLKKNAYLMIIKSVLFYLFSLF